MTRRTRWTSQSLRRERASLTVLLLVLGACTEALPPGGTGKSPHRPGASSSPSFAPSAPTRGPSRAGRRPSATVAVIGDMGTGGEAQRDVARALCRRSRRRPRLGALVTTGDNVYPAGEPHLFEERFFEPYACLLARGIPFRAALGNHDVGTDGAGPVLAEEGFGMRGRYYRFSVGPVAFVVLDSNLLDEQQLRWLERVLPRLRRAPWTVAVFHHPPYSGGAEHGSDERARALLEPLFRRFGVDLVLTGHEHVYSRARAGGITYVVTGGGGAALYPCASHPPRAVVLCRAVHHFVLLRATTARLRLRAFAVDGATVDTVAVDARR